MRTRFSLLIISLLVITIAGCGAKSEPVLPQEAKDWLKTYRSIGIAKVDAEIEEKRMGKKNTFKFDERFAKLMGERQVILDKLSGELKTKFTDEMENVNDEIQIRMSLYRARKELTPR